MTNLEIKKYKTKKAVVVLISGMAVFLAMLFFLIYVMAGHYLFAFALDATFSAESLAPTGMAPELKKPKRMEQWYDDAKKTEVSISSYDGYRLNGFEIMGVGSEKWVILVHGYRNSLYDMTYYAYEYNKRGYSVLLVNLKGHGASEGRYITMGKGDSRDLVLWAEDLSSRYENAKIVLHGVSMGAATVMLATGQQLPSSVKVAIEDCGYTSAKAQFGHVAKEVLKLPFQRIIMSCAEIFFKANMKMPLSEIDCTAALKKSKTPTLFIHGSADDFVPFYMQDILFDSLSAAPKEKLVVDGASHAYSATQNPELYFKTVFDFCERYL